MYDFYGVNLNQWFQDEGAMQSLKKYLESFANELPVRPVISLSFVG
jgi:hypothetical protein